MVATKSNTVCPLCHRSVKVTKGGLLPTHGHSVSRGWHRGGAGKCPTSGFSLAGLDVIRVWTSAFGLLK